MRDNQVLTPVLDELGVKHVFRANPRQHNLGQCCMFLWRKRGYLGFLAKFLDFGPSPTLGTLQYASFGPKCYRNF